MTQPNTDPNDPDPYRKPKPIPCEAPSKPEKNEDSEEE